MDHSTFGIKNPELLVDPKFEVTVEQSEENIYIGSKVSAIVKVTSSYTRNCRNEQFKLFGEIQKLLVR